MWTQWWKKFSTKKELLRYLWKNEDDRKLVDRMVARGEVRLEWRIYVLEEKEKEVSSSSSDLANDLEYLNNEYEKLEGLLDYSLRRCYDIMRKRGLISSEDTYDDFYEKITEWYWGKEEKANVVECGSERGSELNDVLKKFNIWKASDLA